MSEAYEILVKKEYGGPVNVGVYPSKMPNQIGNFALQFIEKWGMVAAMPDGEDSTGRTRVRLSTPEELVERAFATAEGMFAEMEKRGHVYQFPTLERAREMEREERERN